MTSKIRPSQLDTKGINHIKALYHKYDWRAHDIHQALLTIEKFGISISSVTTQAMRDKAYFYRKQAWEINTYLDKRLGRTVNEKRRVLIEKCKTKCGAIVKGSRGVQYLRPAQQGTSLFQGLRQFVAARPTNNGVGILQGAQVVQDHQSPQTGRAKDCGWLRWFDSIRPDNWGRARL
jgi:hypothetical protein